jgi:hypothetical protein
MGRIQLDLGNLAQAENNLAAAFELFNGIKSAEQEVTVEELKRLYLAKGTPAEIERYEQRLEKTIEMLVGAAARARTGPIKEAWVFHNSGIELFRHSPETNLSSSLFGGFLTAIQAFSFELSRQQLDDLQMGSDRYSFYHPPDAPIFVLGRSTNLVPRGLVLKALAQVGNLFAQQFEDALASFDGNDLEPYGAFESTYQSIDMTLL